MNLTAQDDGITHINVYSRGRTELGQLLSNFAPTPFRLADDGAFNSIEGYWYWLPTRDDRLRKLVGYPAKRLGRLLRKDDWRMDETFRDKVRLALRAKLMQNARVRDLLVASTLPFKHYYVYAFSGREVVHDVTDENRWLLDVFDRVRSRVDE